MGRKKAGKGRKFNYRPFERATQQAAHKSNRATCFLLVLCQTAQAHQQSLFQDRPAISICLRGFRQGLKDTG
jgi:hypothetical protein